MIYSLYALGPLFNQLGCPRSNKTTSKDFQSMISFKLASHHKLSLFDLFEGPKVKYDHNTRWPAHDDLLEVVCTSQTQDQSCSSLCT